VTERIERRWELPAPVQDAWHAVTDPAWLTLWLADEVELELRPGGPARFRVGGAERTGWVEQASPPHADEEPVGRLAFWWSADGEPASRVELTLTEIDDAACSIRVIETRPLEVLDLTGIPTPGYGGGATPGPQLIAA
jgi:uncharacterized protein YndB with AHSA1/START domain